MPRKRTAGRKKGGSNKGYFFRKGRGWVAWDGGAMPFLLYDDGTPIRRADEAADVLKDAYARFRLQRDTEEQQVNEVTLHAVCVAYLQYVEAEGASETFRMRADTLFDFCTGLPARHRSKSGSTVAPAGTGRKAVEKERIHPGYGGLKALELTPYHVDQWLAAHKGWKNSKRTHVQALKRALNYAVDRKLIPANPIKGYKTKEANGRKTYITPEQEQACYKNCRYALRTAMKVCIRTGARPGAEFAKLTAKHVRDHGDRMEWHFTEEESKTRTYRIIRITDPEIIEITRRQMRDNPSGPIFRNSQGRPWKRAVLSEAFRRLKRRLRKKGIKLDAGDCMYSWRHTFAKRTLQGHWAGKPTTIEVLAELMGNWACPQFRVSVAGNVNCPSLGVGGPRTGSRSG